MIGAELSFGWRGCHDAGPKTTYIPNEILSHFPLKKTVVIFLLLVFAPIAASAAQFLAGRRPRKLADRGPVERRSPATGDRACPCPDQDLRGTHGAMAQHLCGPHLDRREGKRCEPLQPVRLHGAGRTDPK
jgi:hypothetical protein